MNANQILHYENMGGLLVRRDGFLNWRCPDCKKQGQSKKVLSVCPLCKNRPSQKAPVAKRITTHDAVRAAKARKTAHPASALASDLGSTSRAVATAMRAAVKDGRVSIRYIGGIAFYRFVRLSKRGATP